MDINLLQERQKTIANNEQYTKSICFYCGKLLMAEENNNAEDYGLHYETIGKSCCKHCNDLVTTTNRYLSLAINSKSSLSKQENILAAIQNLQQSLNVLKNER